MTATVWASERPFWATISSSRRHQRLASTEVVYDAFYKLVRSSGPGETVDAVENMSTPAETETTAPSLKCFNLFEETTVVAPSMDLQTRLCKQVEDASPDLLRDIVRSFANS